MPRFVPVIALAAASIAMATLGWVASLHRDAARASTSTPVVASPSVAIAVAKTSDIPAPVHVKHTTHAQAPARSSAPATEVLPSLVPGEAGMRAFYDPETGTIGAPTVLQASSPIPVVEQGVPVEKLATDGSPMIDLKGTLQEYVMFHVSLDGKKSTLCGPDQKQALDELTAPPAAQPVKE